MRHLLLRSLWQYFLRGIFQRVGLIFGALYQVKLIGNNYYLYVGPRMLVHLLDPVVKVLESRLVKQVEDQDDPIGSLVVRVGDRAVSLLPSCVPYL